MDTRRNHFDVANSVDTTDCASVNREIRRIFLDLYPDADSQHIDRCIGDVVRLYRGEHPSYRACDTEYHDIQHVFDVALAMARLMDGYDRTQRTADSIGPRLFSFGVIVALLHDVGYLRHVNDSRHGNGAEYTKIHVSRGSRFVERYLVDFGMDDLAIVARDLIHFTGYERPVSRIQVPGIKFRLLGHMLGTADIIAQMADRCYLEKCRDRLFPEFVEGGLAARGKDDDRSGIVFASVEELIAKTPKFYETATARLNHDLGGAHRYVQQHFDGQHLYFEEMKKNVDYASIIAGERDLSLLRRTLN
ncbi:MAG TPA: HD domain-containing protein [Burkholderiales bacterium]|nr:HD domain-containing protein [Burkholderiales bacterium]